MPETTKGLLLGILFVLEFLEFLTSSEGLIASLWIGIYSFIELTFHTSLTVAIAVSSLFASISFWLLGESEGRW
ncbi:hypothetical protein K9N68_00255 [Kovacikia minuta CCNUW1]|uniref:hypothetical protein n=1 Tax=Kovacikia minuta TaxID=2931930 RepID=UPI001CCA19EB|nr:hypothetical protein [Kovacikia minuta]UBF26486.1 hypothetical protein K9N68_00255 [Kovacikia minuta CCNUW1]